MLVLARVPRIAGKDLVRYVAEEYRLFGREHPRNALAHGRGSGVQLTQTSQHDFLPGIARRDRERLRQVVVSAQLDAAEVRERRDEETGKLADTSLDRKRPRQDLNGSILEVQPDLVNVQCAHLDRLTGP